MDKKHENPIERVLREQREEERIQKDFEKFIRNFEDDGSDFEDVEYR